jgi:hypothetical protein
MHNKDSPIQRSDDSAGPGTPVKTRSETGHPVAFNLTLTQIQPPCLCGPLSRQAVTHVPPPHKNHGKAQDPSHGRPLKRYINPSQGIVDSINWLDQPCRSPPMILTLKLIFLHPTCLRAGSTPHRPVIVLRQLVKHARSAKNLALTTMMKMTRTRRHFYHSPMLPQIQPARPASTQTLVPPYVAKLARQISRRSRPCTVEGPRNELSLQLPEPVQNRKYSLRLPALHLLVLHLLPLPSITITLVIQQI